MGFYSGRRHGITTWTIPRVVSDPVVPFPGNHPRGPGDPCQTMLTAQRYTFPFPNPSRVVFLGPRASLPQTIIQLGDLCSGYSTRYISIRFSPSSWIPLIVIVRLSLSISTRTVDEIRSQSLAGVALFCANLGRFAYSVGVSLRTMVMNRSIFTYDSCVCVCLHSWWVGFLEWCLFGNWELFRDDSKFIKSFEMFGVCVCVGVCILMSFVTRL